MDEQIYAISRALIAKSDQSNHSGNYLPLCMHLHDTADIIRYLVIEWLAASVYAAIDLSRDELIRLAIFLAAIHDIGKATSVFQCKIINAAQEAGERITAAGLDTSTLSDGDKIEHKYEHHTFTGAAIIDWFMQKAIPDDKERMGLLWLPSVIGAHHGRTLPSGTNLEKIMDQEYAMYGGKGKAKGTVDRNEPLFKGVWQIYLNEALEMAGYQSLRDIPRNITQPAQILLAALLITADWLASNTAFCPLIAADTLLNKNLYPARSTRAISMIDLPKPWQLNDEWRYDDLCSARFDLEQPNAIQTEIQRIAAETQNPGLIILEAPMGMGKTEAALAASEILAERLGERGLAFFLPSQATANCMFRRVTRWTSRFAQWERLSVELAHGKAMFNDEFARLVENANSVDDEPDAGACDKSEQKGRNSQTDEYDASSNADAQSGLMAHTFFLGRKTQLLADFVVGTVDQLLMGALKQKHIMLRHLGLAGKVVVIDEVHAYDSFMNRYLDCMLSWLGAYHTPVILLSATLPGKRRAEMVGAYLRNSKFEEYAALKAERAYPLITWTDGGKALSREVDTKTEPRTVKIIRAEDSGIISFLRERMKDGGCAGIIVNTVARAQQMLTLIKAELADYATILDHAQFAMPDRIRREERIVERLGKESTPEKRDRLIVIGTQVLEQSLDIDFDTLITDLCPMDLLLQRIGRLQRHIWRTRPASASQPVCMVLGTDLNALEPGAEFIYGRYMLMKTACLLKDEICLPNDISELVQMAYDEKVDEGLAECGELKKEREEYVEEEKGRFMHANTMCIRNAPVKLGRRPPDLKMNGLTDPTDLSDAYQEAAVRDGVPSLEVLILVMGGDGLLHCVTEGEDELAAAPNAAPSKEETDIILRQSLRLPHMLSHGGIINDVINELENTRRTTLKEWTNLPRIGRELFLILNADRRAKLAGINISYDSEYGLRCEKEVKGEGEGV